LNVHIKAAFYINPLFHLTSLEKFEIASVLPGRLYKYSTVYQI